MPEEMVAMFLKENVQRSTIQKRKPKQKKIWQPVHGSLLNLLIIVCARAHMQEL
jgi:hypothetical protein